jgi:hypothetical protein
MVLNPYSILRLAYPARLHRIKVGQYNSNFYWLEQDTPNVLQPIRRREIPKLDYNKISANLNAERVPLFPNKNLKIKKVKSRSKAGKKP